MLRLAAVLLLLLPAAALAQSREFSPGPRFDAQGNMMGTDPRGQADPTWCRDHAKGALDLLNCSQVQHGGAPVNRENIGRAPENWHPGVSPGPNCPSSLAGPALDSCRRGDSSNIWRNLPNRY
jgi:hypothetical protein